MANEDQVNTQSDSGVDRGVAVLIPCHNEAKSIKKVIDDFRKELPQAAIYVYDNNSSDNTPAIANAAGAIVIPEKRIGKGFVVAAMFEKTEADIFVLVDGDDTYQAKEVHELMRPIMHGEADMVVGSRFVELASKSFPMFHAFGNRLVARTVSFIFGSKLTDIMSGYRVFNREFVKKTAITSRGFEVETQMTVQALYHDFIIKEVPIKYGQRSVGSHSKLRTLPDGIRVLITIFDIFKAYRPLLFFSSIGGVVLALGLAIGSIPTVEFVYTGKVLHFPSAILASGLVILAALSFVCGIILDTFNYRVRELRQSILRKP